MLLNTRGSIEYFVSVNNKQIFHKVKWDIRNYSVELVEINKARLNNSDVPFYRFEYMVLS